MNTHHTLLIGDAWVAGQRDHTGLAIPLMGSLNRLAPSQAHSVTDLTGPGGLGAALRRLAGFHTLGKFDACVVVLGIEDAPAEPHQDDWIAGYRGLVHQLARRVSNRPVLVIPPKVDLGAPSGGFTKGARRWSGRVPRNAIEVVIEHDYGLAKPLVPSDLERADDVWLKPTGMRSLAHQIGLAVTASKSQAG